ncbi:acyl-CoA dehydrogenase family protein [Sphingobium sp.]|uniref:acyl-CoA dehydrogenase family protein n=1 Tax=Sphingobium sp. TaxID=1912891 RepID=UPI0028BF42EE|nr:acyl-CoA dehydrogenase family protein [Sphingobium sp.]
MSAIAIGKASAVAETSPQAFSEAGVIDRARAIRPTLVPLQEEVEARTFYSEEVHQQFKDAGFYRILTPKKYGGLEFDIETFFRVILEITAGCPSTGWMLCLGGSRALNVGALFEEDIQAELFADPDFIAPCVLKPSGTATPLADGDWEISGVYPYCSGAPYSGYFIGRAAHAHDGSPVLFIASAHKYTRLDDWGGQLGMKGTGSHSLKLERAVIPGRLIFPGLDIMEADIVDGTPGSRLHGNPIYAGGAKSFFIGETALIGIGIAMNALDTYEALMHKNVTFGPPAPRTHDPHFQAWYGTAAGKILSAEAIVMTAARQWTEAARDGRFTDEFEMRLMAMFREANDLAWDAMEIMFRTAGTSNLADGTRMQRAWRDMSTLRSHNGVVFFSEVTKGLLTRLHFGVA